jgi:integrase
MDMRNIKPLGPNKYRIRFKYRDPLTGEQVVYQKTLSGVTLVDARAHRDEARAAALRKAREPAPRRARSFVDSYLATRARRDPGRRGRPISASTLERDAFALDLHIIPEIGDWIVSRITLEDLDELVDRWCLKEKSAGTLYAASSINVWIKVLKLFLKHACRGVGVESPAEDLEVLPLPSERKGRALTPSEVAALLEWIEESAPQHLAMVWLAVTTGARFSELAAVHWDQVDEDAGVIAYTHSVYKGRRRRGSKTGAEVRAPLAPNVIEALARHRERLVQTRHPLAGGDIVFPARVLSTARAEYAGYQTRTGLAKTLARAARELKQDPITPHDLRRTCNTLMLGVAREHVVQAITGHSTSEMTHHYTFVDDASKATAVAKVLTLIEGGKGQRRVNDAEDADREGRIESA